MGRAIRCAWPGTYEMDTVEIVAVRTPPGENLALDLQTSSAKK